MATVNAGIGDVLAFVGRNKHRPVVVGIGEQAHGEEVSWGFRTEIMKRLAAAYPTRPMTVLCENADFFVKDFRKKRQMNFTTFSDPGTVACQQFYPCLTPFSNQTLVQMDAAIEIVDLCKHRVHGIDIQQLDFATDLPAGHAVTKRVQSTGAKATWMKASKPTQAEGHLRNKLNADLVISFARKGTIILYFAQNEHVSNMSEGVHHTYSTDGWHLAKSKDVEYLSVATFCPRLWATWANAGKQTLFKASKPYKHSEKEFDVVLSTPKSQKMTFIGC